MNLSSLIVVTDDRLSRTVGRRLPETVKKAASGGASTFLFREKHLPTPERSTLADEVAGALPDTAQLIVASDHILAERIHADGVHLASHDPPYQGDLVVGRSCHDLSELAKADAEEADYVTLSPLYASVSKPDYGPGMDLQLFGELVAQYTRPVYAMGGIGPGCITPAMSKGAHGVAVAGSVMGAHDPADVVARILAELGEPR